MTILEEKVDLKKVASELNDEYSRQQKLIYIENIAGGYQILTKEDISPYIHRLMNKSRNLQLSHPALEALSIIAYRQPISRPEIESIRGVSCDSVIKSLLERELITIKGRENSIGRALLYGTTQSFLEIFGLNDVTDLPKLKEIDELVEDGYTPTSQADATK